MKRKPIECKQNSEASVIFLRKAVSKWMEFKSKSGKFLFDKKNTIKTLKLWNIIKILKNCFIFYSLTIL